MESAYRTVACVALAVLGASAGCSIAALDTAPSTIAPDQEPLCDDESILPELDLTSGATLTILTLLVEGISTLTNRSTKGLYVVGSMSAVSGTLVTSGLYGFAERERCRNVRRARRFDTPEVPLE